MLIVQTHGGSSLRSIDRVKRVAERIVRTCDDGHEVVVVCSAMGDTSDALIELARQVCPNPPAAELDMLLTSGERVSNALVASAVGARGTRARSFLGAQAGVLTDSAHGRAKIIAVAMAAALNADLCEIYTDVDGVLTTDPRIVQHARPLEEVPYKVMLEMAVSGGRRY
jgi:aspartate kinase